MIRVCLRGYILVEINYSFAHGNRNFYCFIVNLGSNVLDEQIEKNLPLKSRTLKIYTCHLLRGNKAGI